MVESLTGGPVPFRYHAEARPGLSWARNAGIAVADGDIIAFVDDDDEPDRYWLAGIATGFAGDTTIGSVAGLILPARLDTAAEELFEQQGGHRLGRGFAPERFSRAGPQNPLFPLPPFGTGANMAFRREALRTIGGFDVALGAGTCTVRLRGYAGLYAHPAGRLRHRLRAFGADVASPPAGHGKPGPPAARVQHRPDRLLRGPAPAPAGRAARATPAAALSGPVPQDRLRARTRSPNCWRSWTDGTCEG